MDKIELAYLRNKLWDENFSADDNEVLERCITYFSNNRTLFSSIIIDCLQNAKVDIKSQNYKTASYEIGLIHNMPTGTSEIQKWDEEHFYEFELPLYFDNIDIVERLKKKVVLCAEMQKALIY